MTIYEDYMFSLLEPDCVVADYFICGTEYEIEDIYKVNLPNFDCGQDVPHWMGDIGAIKDGSLRNNGMEFITKPVGYDKALSLFDLLHDKVLVGQNAYTPRTSTHVHVNVASMNQKQLKHLVLLYALFEPVFFAYVGDSRKHNIHCVPLNYTLLPKMYSASVSHLVDGWSKYTAFNMKPVATQGTVEFRHLYGTGDKKVYQQWLSMLRDLWNFAYNEPPTWLHGCLLAGTSPKEMLKQVLPSIPLHLVDVDFSDSLVDVKLAFV